ncbi:MAG: 3-hydroxyacyl-CoA dehydrogenase family protein [Bacteroidia bacterium]|nr:3-hydroxyacyl-CoA dehydrogenase family protein [Bacteroidia bacterium]
MVDIVKVALSGDEERRKEFKSRLPELDFIFEGEGTPPYEIADDCHVFIDLNLDDNLQRLPYYLKQDAVLIACSVKKSLRQLLDSYVGPVEAKVLGLNALPTFLSRPVWEVAIVENESVELWEGIAQKWGLDIELVADRVGMVTPRVILPIINEAFVMWQEGTAEPTDIDVAMKLGTNYPKGPVSWANEIGLRNVVDVLDALDKDLGGNRFRPCRLLKEKALAEK